MNGLKRFFTLMLVVSMIGSSLTTSFAATTNVSVEGKAQILNTLGILRGTGTGYNLEGKLKRSEAATFIVRFLGVENEVLADRTDYSNTDYSDVASDSWYAPYVGYCDEEGIINGYADGSFKPEEYLSEKAFLKMLLVVLGFEYEEDFDWNSVYYMAYTKDVVSDEDYRYRATDNTNYTRGDVIEVLHTSMQIEHKDTGKQMIETFIEKDIISEEQAKKLLLMRDTVDTEIEKIIAEDEETILVTFNEAIKDLEEEQITVYLSADDEVQFEVNSVTDRGGNTYRIRFEDEQAIEEKYTIVIAEVVDAYGNRNNYSLKKEFLGYRPENLQSDFFRISKVEQVSNNVIYVYFTHPVNSNAYQPKYYNIYEGTRLLIDGDTTTMQINQLAGSDNGVSIYLRNFTFKEEGMFKLSIDSGLTSSYGVQLNDGKGDSVTFESNVDENERFELKDIETLNDYTVMLEFNKVLNSVIAEQVFSYYLMFEDEYPIRINKAEVVGSGNVVYLTTDERMFDRDEFTLMINHITDTTKQFSITEREYEFKADIDFDDELEIKGVSVVDGNTITVKFDRVLGHQSASDPDNYEIWGITETSYIGRPIAAYHKEGSQEVKLFLDEDDALENRDRYELVIIGTLKDIVGNSYNRVDDYNFRHNRSDVTATFIEKATTIGSDSIKVEFNKEIALGIPNILNTNYSLFYYDNGIKIEKVPTHVTYSNPLTMVMKFDSLDLDHAYEITFDELVNYGGIRTTNKNDAYSVDVEIGK
jgi:hypothetical protein